MHQTTCECENALCPADTGGFYVTVRDDGRVGYLLGPYATHAEALAQVDRGNQLACKADGRAHGYSYGTARVKFGTLPLSVFGV